MNVGNAGNLTRCEKNQNFLCNGTAILLQTLRGSEKVPCCSSNKAHIVPSIRAGRICGMQMPQTRKMFKLSSVHRRTQQPLVLPTPSKANSYHVSAQQEFRLAF